MFMFHSPFDEDNQNEDKKISQPYKLVLNLGGVLVILIGVVVLVIGVYIKQSKNTNLSFENEQEAVVVDIAGAVNSPGVYHLNKSLRLKDVIDLAGGFSDLVSFTYISKEINLATKIEDSTKIYIPYYWEVCKDNCISLVVDVELVQASNTIQPIDVSLETKAPDQTTTDNGYVDVQSTLININTASEVELISLPGIGTVTAQKIIQNRPYTDLDQLLSNQVLSQSKYDSVIDQLQI